MARSKLLATGKRWSHFVQCFRGDERLALRSRKPARPRTSRQISKDQATQADKRLSGTWGAQKFWGPKPGHQTGSRLVDDRRDMLLPLPAYPPTGGTSGPPGWSPPTGGWNGVPMPQPLPAYPAGPSPMLPNSNGDRFFGFPNPFDFGTTKPKPTISGGEAPGLRESSDFNQGEEEGEGDGDGEEDPDEQPAEETKDETAADVGEEKTKEELQADYEKAMADAMNQSYSGRRLTWVDDNPWFSSLDEDNITLAQAAEEARNPWLGIGRRNYLRNRAELEARAAAMDPDEVARQAINAGMRLNLDIAMTAAGIGLGIVGIAGLAPQGVRAARYAASRHAIKRAGGRTELMKTGNAFEKYVLDSLGLEKSWARIKVPGSKANYRVPDIFREKELIGDIKWTSKKVLDHSDQLRDLIKYAKEENIPFDLYVKRGVRLADDLLEDIAKSGIKFRHIQIGW